MFTSIAVDYICSQFIDYTAPVFFWTNIELSLAIVCACLPTLRPIYLHFFPKPVTTTSSGYGYGSSKQTGTKKSTLGAKFGHSPYEELEELELTRHGQTRAGSPEGGITREVTIHQTTEPSEDSSTTSLRGKSVGA